VPPVDAVPVPVDAVDEIPVAAPEDVVAVTAAGVSGAWNPTTRADPAPVRARAAMALMVVLRIGVLPIRTARG
jgi:hypothetical protein